MSAMRVANLFSHGRPHVLRQRLVEPMTLDQRGVERRHALPTRGPNPLGIEVRDDDRQPGVERRLSDRLVHRPRRPPDAFQFTASAIPAASRGLTAR